jgi:two-component system cell cycle response regulator CtrA
MSSWKPAAAAAARKQIGRVLVVEDDSAIARSVELILKSESFNVYATEFGEQGVDLGKHYFYDIILLDLGLPDMSGFEVLRSLRASKVKTPILILSGIASIENKVKGLGFGADDYMTKPFHKSELLARIHAIIRRSQNHSQSVVQTGDLIVNLGAKTVEVQGERVHLTIKEYQMLELLSLRKGSTLTKEMFLNQLYGGMDEPGIKIIDIFLCKIRKKLARASNGKNYIETVWGRGYLLRDPQDNTGEVAVGCRAAAAARPRAARRWPQKHPAAPDPGRPATGSTANRNRPDKIWHCPATPIFSRSASHS